MDLESTLEITEEPSPGPNARWKLRQLHLHELLFCLGVISCIFTVTPSLAPALGMALPPYPDYYFTGVEFVRLFAAYLVVPLNVGVFFVAGPKEASRYASICLLLVVIAYMEGHVFHLTTNMFGRIFKKLSCATTDPQCASALDYARNYIEHRVAHYYYAVGAAGFMVLHLVVSNFAESQKFRDLECRAKSMVVSGALAHGALIVAVTAEFPAGFYVFLTVLGLVLGLLAGLLLLKRRDPEVPLPKGLESVCWVYYVIAFLEAFVIGLIVAAVTGGDSRNN